jgi:hypothetical protein
MSVHKLTGKKNQDIGAQLPASSSSVVANESIQETLHCKSDGKDPAPNTLVSKWLLREEKEL